MNRIIILLLFFMTTQLQAIEIWLNGTLYESYTDESLRELSYNLPEMGNNGILLSELLPLMEEIHSFRFISDNYILETDMDDSLIISSDDDGFILQSDGIGKITLPQILEIGGIPSDTEKLTVWFDEADPQMEREIRLFARLHHMEVVFRIEKNLRSLLEYNIFNETIIPDLIIYNDEKLNEMSPLLNSIDENDFTMDLDKILFSRNNKLLALPFKISRQIFLKGSAGGQNQFFTADFGNVDLLYPLFLRFGLMGNLTEENVAVKESFFYLTGLFNQGIYKLSNDPDEDFIMGNINSIYTSSTILNKLNREPYIAVNRVLPQLGGENPPPLLSYKLISLAEGHRNKIASRSLLHYLTSYGVQQRIDPRTGYLPFRNEVYHLLNESSSKELLLEDLDKAVQLSPGEEWDKLRFVLPKVYRLIITGRLTIDEGLSEMVNYINN